MEQESILWERHWKDVSNKPAVHPELLREILSLVCIKDARVLEIGAGLGGDIVYLAKKGAKATALDFSKASLERIEELAESKRVHIDVIEADARDLPFKDGVFDVIFHQGFLEHFFNPLPLLEEQRRVLKRGGFILVDVPHKYNLYTLYKRWKMSKNKWITPWETEYGGRGLSELLKKARLTPMRVYYRGFFPPGFSKIIKGDLPTRLRFFRFLNIDIFHLILKHCGQKLDASPLKIFYYQNIGIVAQKPKKEEK